MAAGVFHVRGELEGHSGAVTDLDWSPDGELLATCARDHTVRVWDVRSRAPLWTGRHDDEAMSVRFSPDGAMVASSGRDCRVFCWSARDGAKVNTFFGPAPFRSV